MSRGCWLINGKCSFCRVGLADQTSHLSHWKSVAFSHEHAAPTQAAIPTRDSANQSIQELHQDKGIRIPGFLISQSRFIIIDSKPARRYQAAA